MRGPKEIRADELRALKAHYGSTLKVLLANERVACGVNAVRSLAAKAFVETVTGAVCNHNEIIAQARTHEQKKSSEE